MKENLLKMNLQFFGEEESVDELDRDQSTEEETDLPSGSNEEQEELVEPKKQSATDNAIAAAARRKAESEIAQRDRRIAERCRGIVNPVTGQTINNEKEYLEALDAQERLNSEQELQRSGIPTKALQAILKGMPEFQDLNRLREKLAQDDEERSMAETMDLLTKDVKEITKIDPSIKTMNDLLSLERMEDIISYVSRGISLKDSYKLVYSDDIIQKTANRVKQGTINQIKGKAHLQTTDGYSQDSQMKEVSTELLESLRGAFPGVKDSELVKKAQNFL